METLVYENLFIFTLINLFLVLLYEKVLKIKRAIIQNRKNKNLKSDHIFLCILHSKICLFYEYNTWEVIW